MKVRELVLVLEKSFVFYGCQAEPEIQVVAGKKKRHKMRKVRPENRERPVLLLLREIQRAVVIAVACQVRYKSFKDGGKEEAEQFALQVSPRPFLFGLILFYWCVI